MAQVEFSGYTEPQLLIGRLEAQNRDLHSYLNAANDHIGDLLGEKRVLHERIQTLETTLLSLNEERTHLIDLLQQTQNDADLLVAQATEDLRISKQKIDDLSRKNAELALRLSAAPSSIETTVTQPPFFKPHPNQNMSESDVLTPQPSIQEGNGPDNDNRCQILCAVTKAVESITGHFQLSHPADELLLDVSKFMDRSHIQHTDALDVTDLNSALVALYNVCLSWQSRTTMLCEQLESTQNELTETLFYNTLAQEQIKSLENQLRDTVQSCPSSVDDSTPLIKDRLMPLLFAKQRLIVVCVLLLSRHSRNQTATALLHWSRVSCLAQLSLSSLQARHLHINLAGSKMDHFFLRHKFTRQYLHKWWDYIGRTAKTANGQSVTVVDDPNSFVESAQQSVLVAQDVWAPVLDRLVCIVVQYWRHRGRDALSLWRRNHLWNTSVCDSTLCEPAQIDSSWVSVFNCESSVPEPGISSTTHVPSSVYEVLQPNISSVQIQSEPIAIWSPIDSVPAEATYDPQAAHKSQPNELRPKGSNILQHINHKDVMDPSNMSARNNESYASLHSSPVRLSTPPLVPSALRSPIRTITDLSTLSSVSRHRSPDDRYQRAKQYYQNQVVSLSRRLLESEDLREKNYPSTGTAGRVLSLVPATQGAMGAAVQVEKLSVPEDLGIVRCHYVTRDTFINDSEAAASE
eukprot:GILK01010841.1.p1 GENE.GILK01010841.1~~GILK01010841.1.p1  ORF type:complete len:703 (-),score=110.99 GILK01010841.1:70-2136(-)